MVWWQTQKTAQVANPGARVPRGRAAGPVTIAIDTREKYGWKFSGREVEMERRALPSGDYASVVDGALAAVVERKTLENLATSLSDGTLPFQMQKLAEAPHAAVVVEADYTDLFRSQPGRGSWLADMIGRLAARYPEVPIIFAGSRRFAEEWAWRFLSAAAADAPALELYSSRDQQVAESVAEAYSAFPRSMSRRRTAASGRGDRAARVDQDNDPSDEG
jgi:hypothetical protein